MEISKFIVAYRLQEGSYRVAPGAEVYGSEGDGFGTGWNAAASTTVWRNSRFRFPAKVNHFFRRPVTGHRSTDDSRSHEQGMRLIFLFGLLGERTEVYNTFKSGLKRERLPSRQICAYPVSGLVNRLIVPTNVVRQRRVFGSWQERHRRTLLLIFVRVRWKGRMEAFRAVSAVEWSGRQLVISITDVPF